ncbi:E3 SUMO-protein ligase PIAS4 [Eumeta japonica]|uniref:E3 SUMO-protein ligase PIAS4 n=1 Tax=Eumeta variegata TaxID=151549 RepID=A0A4C1Y3H2_EUMVA|nr:E3 SUMO-protein ligase PIAS4 [Eumeta japonica]
MVKTRSSARVGSAAPGAPAAENGSSSELRTRLRPSENGHRAQKGYAQRQVIGTAFACPCWSLSSACVSSSIYVDTKETLGRSRIIVSQCNIPLACRSGQLSAASGAVGSGGQGKDPLAPVLPPSRALYQHPAVTAGYVSSPSLPVSARQNPMYAGGMYHGYGADANTAPLAPMPAPSPSAPMAPYPVHPDVKFKKLPFYDVLAELMKPSTLMPMQAGRMQETSFMFHLTPQQATDIATGKDVVGAGNKLDYVVQAQLRFCLLETSCEQEDHFPPSVNVKVNNKICPLPNPIPTNKPTPEPKRPPRPVNISSLVKLSPTVPNTILVTWASDFTRAYVISVFMVRKLTSAELLQRLKNKGTKNPDYTRSLKYFLRTRKFRFRSLTMGNLTAKRVTLSNISLTPGLVEHVKPSIPDVVTSGQPGCRRIPLTAGVKEKLSEDYDNEIATTSLRVSLMCPLGKMRMSCPCRPANCPHLQCFDASLFLQMNERKPTWLCPVCDRPAPYDSLVVDGYFQEVLTSPRLSSDCNEIQLHQDGSWSAHTPPPRTTSAAIHQPTASPVTLISDDLEVIPVDGGNSNSGGGDSKRAALGDGRTPKPAAAEVLVDLTSDSEDELPLKRKVPQPKSTPPQPPPPHAETSSANEDAYSTSNARREAEFECITSPAHVASGTALAMVIWPSI